MISVLTFIAFKLRDKVVHEEPDAAVVEASVPHCHAEYGVELDNIFDVNSSSCSLPQMHASWLPVSCNELEKREWRTAVQRTFHELLFWRVKT